jgi:CBS domain containing-hemolysin-like protein
VTATPLALLLALVLVSLAGHAFLSASEIALLSANRIRLRHRARSGQPAARRALRLAERPEPLLTLFLAGQTGFGVLCAALATALAIRVLGATWLAPVLATLGVTLLVMVIGEFVPKAAGRRRPEAFLLRHVRALEFLHHFFLPLTQSVHGYVRGLLWLLRHERREAVVTREELKVLLRRAEGRDEADQREQRMLTSILEFRETVAREVMIPMNRAVALPAGTSCAAWREEVRRHGYTRMPVYETQRDRVVGVVNIFDLLYDPQPGDAVDAYVRQAPIVPDSKRIDRLLVELQKARHSMAVVVDEFGACRGIVTVEDIVEEIVGEMEDEHEVDRPKLRRLAPGVYVVSALTDIDDVNQDLGLQLPKGRYDTVGGLVLKRAGRVPRVGERFTLHGAVFEVLDAHPYGVRSLKLTLPPPGDGRGPTA